ncbi:hypothetical protein OAD57_10580 [Porticoccaceae bacterium]|nr:hypothetical protein [Porticoccaceae bacterium]
MSYTMKIAEISALSDLECFLKPRVEAAYNGELSDKSIEDIFTEVEVCQASSKLKVESSGE